MEFRFCNCSECGVELRSVFNGAGQRIDRDGWEHVKGRPLCDRCNYVPVPTWSNPASRDDDAGPWQENAVREMEEGRF